MKRTCDEKNNKQLVLTTKKRFKDAPALVATTDPIMALPPDLLGDIYLKSFQSRHTVKTPRQIKKQIQTICLIDKWAYEYICKPNNIRTLINNTCMSSPCYRGLLTQRLVQNNNPPAIVNYVATSILLHDQIYLLSLQEIRYLVEHNGADVNFCSYSFNGKECYYPPVLSNIHKDLDKTKLLLKLGANPNLPYQYKVSEVLEPHLIREGIIYKNIPPFVCAIQEKNIEAVKLFFEYCPYYPGRESLNTAIQTHNMEIIQLILQQNVPITDLSEGMRLSSKLGNMIIAKLLLNATINANTPLFA